MIKIGIIGSGFGLYGLLPAFNSTPGCKVVSICGKKSARLINYCESIGLGKIYTDWREMLDKENLDALAIAVTPNAQYEIAKVAIKKGLHIFAEKPLAATYAQAKELRNLASKMKIITVVDFIFPEIEEWKKVKQLLNIKKYGKLKHISVSWEFLSYDIKNKIHSWKTDIEQGGGALSFYFSHVLHYLEYFAGEILDLKSLLSYSKESPNGGEVGVDILINFKNGVYGNAHLNCNSKGLIHHQLIFRCEKATLVLENHNSLANNFEIKIYRSDKITRLTLKKKLGKKNDDERVNVIKNLTSRFVKGIAKNEKVFPSFVQGLRVQQLIEIIRAS